MLRNFALTLGLFASAAFAQKTELGVLTGGGAFGAEDVSGSYWIAGAELSAFADKRTALFVEYEHYGRIGSESLITSVDLVSGGLRVQGTQGRFRPFFDAGISGGQDRFARGTHNLVGVALGGGVTISVGERWYVRPAFRVHGLRGLHAAAGFTTSIGYRF